MAGRFFSRLPGDSFVGLIFISTALYPVTHSEHARRGWGGRVAVWLLFCIVTATAELSFLSWKLVIFYPAVAISKNIDFYCICGHSP